MVATATEKRPEQHWFPARNTTRTDNTTLFLHVNHICNAESAVFSATFRWRYSSTPAAQTELQPSPRVAERRAISLPCYGHSSELQSQKSGKTLPSSRRPTSDRRVVGFDVFKQPVPIDLVAEEDHHQLN